MNGQTELSPRPGDLEAQITSLEEKVAELLQLVQDRNGQVIA